ncbi:hypothetical protein L1285_16745 [Pseudoalteromonas sp. DL2-H2.2]|uniref:hypothetical protein n=1 Tax=Pseudoalteromonas sp. DL2-H2.2 TaxID=2908889 RepID=UPI001F37047E|nr:hypothetical protein [Pseudoalteromonas sp. DL2-H2.2]MCF2909970.1 hypothetical protein [Pseudoalteromonas sp. DL2-H2.2]
MTTIIYDAFSDQIACDSRTTTKDMIVTDDAQKWFDAGGWRVFCTGQTCDIYTLKQAYLTRSFDNVGHLEFIKYHPEQGVWYGLVENGVLKTEPLTSSYAIGSGQKVAMYGLHQCHPPEDIIEVVKTIDFRTGGKVHCFDVTNAITRD